MSRLPRLTGQEAAQALSRAGFEVLRQRGSHLFLKHADGRATVVPTRSGEVLEPGIMSKILRDTKLSRESSVSCWGRKGNNKRLRAQHFANKLFSTQHHKMVQPDTKSLSMPDEKIRNAIWRDGVAYPSSSF